MEQQGQPFDYLLYATITSGTTHENKDYQRDYLLTMEMINVKTGQYDKQAARSRKGYHHSRVGQLVRPVQRKARRLAALLQRWADRSRQHVP